MSSLNESPVWIDGIYQLELDDPVEGGPDGIDNLQAQQLACRTAWLKDQIDANGMAAHLAAADPHAQYLKKSEAGAAFVAPANAVAKSGDTMTGALVLSGPPVLPLHAAPRQYVDDRTEPVRRPVNTTPAAHTTSFSTTGTLVASQYYSLYGVPQANANFQISTSPGFETVVQDVTVGAVTSRATSPALAASTVYFWRVRYKDAEGAWSPWSQPTRFSTGTALVAVPTITAPAGGQTSVSRTPTLTSSAFAMASGASTHASSRWQVAADDAFTVIVADSDTSAAALTAYTVPTPLNYGQTYYARVLHNSATQGSSGWSAPVAFTTIAGTAGKPTLTEPYTGKTGVARLPTLHSSAFSTVGVLDTHASSRWQVATDPLFGTIVEDSGNLAAAKTAYTLAAPLDYGQSYYARVLHVGTTYGAGSWSDAAAFTVVEGAVLAAQITAPTDGAANVWNNPTLTTTPFASDGAPDTHAATDWEVRTAANGGGTLVWASTNNLNQKTSITVPEGFLAVATTYHVRARHKGTAYGYGAWGASTSFTTAASFVPTVPGTPFAGGYYVGRTVISGEEYALVVAPKAQGEINQYNWKNTSSSTLAAASVIDGRANTLAMDSNHPAASFCKGLAIGGFTDWYLPARDELELMYRNLKPNATNNATFTRDGTGWQQGLDDGLAGLSGTDVAVPNDGLAMGFNANTLPTSGGYTAVAPVMTASALFQAGGSESLPTVCWASTYHQAGSGEWAWVQNFMHGAQFVVQVNKIAAGLCARAVRRVKV